jgi:hypothetical protein
MLTVLTVLTLPFLALAAPVGVHEVDLSPVQVEHPRFVETLMAQLQAHGFPPQWQFSCQSALVLQSLVW